MDSKEKAIELHKKGYNCSQSIVCAFADRTDMDERDLFRLAEGLGFGMAVKETCGAISGVCLLVGAVNSDGDLEKPQSKKTTYKLCKAMMNEFKETVGSLNCAEIKGIAGGEVLKSCDGCIEEAAEILEKYLFAKETET